MDDLPINMPMTANIHFGGNDQSGPFKIMKANLDTDFRFEDDRDVFYDVLSAQTKRLWPFWRRPSESPLT